MTRVFSEDGKTCFDADVGGGIECSYRSSECPRLCVVEDGLASDFYLNNPSSRKSARELINQGARVFGGNDFVGYLFLDHPKTGKEPLDPLEGKREIYGPADNFKGHYLRNIIDIP